MIYAVLGVVFLLILLYLIVPTRENQKATLTDTEHNNTQPELPDISGSLLRSQTADELVQTLNLYSVIDNIKIHLGLSNTNWDKDALPLIHNFLALVQRLPASESHHHAGDGGLARHTLDVAAMALKQSAGRSFPPGGITEDIPRLTPVWKYGILVAALLHDVGKVLTGFKITLSDKDGKNPRLWLPDAGNMPPNMYYSVDFLEENQRYTKHAEIGWSFFMTLVPESTRQWIANMSPDLIHLLRSYLSGNKDGSIIEELVKSADMVSVSQDLAKGSRQRFANARRTPLIETVMDTLQEMLSDKGRYFTIAKDAGGDLFRRGDTIYMISKNVPDFIRNYLKENNHPASGSFPTDNNRIFDTLFEYRAILPNPFDTTKSITNIAVQFTKGGKTTVQTQFTVLAFHAQTLYPKGDYPTEFAGLLEVVAEKAIKDYSEKAQDNNENLSGNLKENDTDNKQNQTENNQYIVPPIMAQPMQTENQSNNEEDESSSLENLLQTDTDNKNKQAEFNSSNNIDTANNETLPEMLSGSPNQNNTDTVFSSIDDLLKQSGVLDIQTDTAETINENDTTRLPESRQSVVGDSSPTDMSLRANEVGVANPNSGSPQTPDTTNDKALMPDGVSPVSPFQAKKETPSGNPNTRKSKQEKLKSLFAPLSQDAENKEEDDAMDIAQPVKLENLLQSDKQDNKQDAMPRPVPIKDAPSLNNIAAIRNDYHIKKALQGTPDDEPDAFRRQGLKFIHWLANGLADGSISFNTNQSFVHFVDKGMLLVTPAAFKQFANGRFSAKNPDCPGVQAQKSFQTLGLISRTHRSHFYQAFNHKKERLFACYLIKESRLHHLIQMATRPANNPNLFILSQDEIYAQQQGNTK